MQSKADTYAAGGPGRLKTEVQDPGLCTACGACTGYCPYIKTFHDRVAFVNQCRLEEGLCYRVCPRTETDLPALRRAVFGSDEANLELGANLDLLMARSSDSLVAGRGQYGGVVTGLMGYALEAGIIDGALMVGGTPAEPEPRLCLSAGDVSRCAGSKYTGVPSLGLLHRAPQFALGAVGRPCQVTALRKLQQQPGQAGNKVALVIGLFCFWSLGPDFYRFLRQRGLDGATAVDIPIDGVVVTTGEGMVRLATEEIRPFIKPACNLCYDPLAELGDVAVGSTEFDDSWNTLLVRSTAGKDLVDRAVGAGMLEVRPYPAERLPLLSQAVFNKRRRVLAALAAESGGTGYLRLGEAERSYYAKPEQQEVANFEPK